LARNIYRQVTNIVCENCGNRRFIGKAPSPEKTLIFRVSYKAMIQVTKPFLPPLEEYQKHVKDIWTREWLTNNGPLVIELEKRLKDYLKLDNLLFVSNGTIAIQIAIKALGLKGKIITTPFSYVATTSSICWEGCEPLFVDIDETTFNISPSKIERAITEDTTGIVATHVYGNPCDIDAIEKIADKYKLKVIYDAAHGFGSKHRDKSIFGYGDVSTASFHATKLFHTIEGGAVFAKDPAVLRQMDLMRNFGHDGPGKFSALGINGKNSEFHAAMGLVNLRYVDEILKTRRELSDHYDVVLKGINALRPGISAGSNYSYYPVLFPNEPSALRVEAALNKNNIFPRRYFWPSLERLPYARPASVPVANDVASRVLCLPLYHTLAKEDIDRIARIILAVGND
jgi:dTDP-4-amino-4,6-dideoxygalactose transaminase